MADSKISALTAVSSATLTQELVVNDAGTSKKITNDQILGLDSTYSSVYNAATATQAPAANTDVYLNGSRVLVPATTGRGSLKVGSQYSVRLHVAKTGAGTAAPIFTVRLGTAGTTSDGSIGSITFAAQTGVIDEGYIEIQGTWTAFGSGTTGALRPVGTLIHRLATTGLSTSGSSCILGAAGTGHNTQLASAGVGVSVNTGASAAWTVFIVRAELFNLA